MRRHGRRTRLTLVVMACGMVMALIAQAVPQHVSADTLMGTRSDQIRTSTAGTVTTHRISLTLLNTTTPVGSLSFEFCSNTPTPNTPCTFPTGFDASVAILSTQSGDTGFTIHANSTANRIVLTRTAANPVGSLSVYQFDNITNPTVAGSYYVRLLSYTSDDGTGPNIEYGGVVFSIQPVFRVSAEVPPYLRFCVGVTIVSFDCATATTYFVDFGTMRTSQTSSASSQFLVATNAQSGYSITLNGTTMTSGTNVIPAMSAPAPSTPGVSQFGLNLKANTTPAVGAEVVGPGTSVANGGYANANQYKFQTGDTLVTVNHSDSNRKFTISYIANISSGQTAGIYTTTITYICLANF